MARLARLARARGRGPGHPHGRALPGRRPYRGLPAALGGALGDGPAEPESGPVDAVKVEAGAAIAHGHVEPARYVGIVVRF
jgi:hypothetical protein